MRAELAQHAGLHVRETAIEQLGPAEPGVVGRIRILRQGGEQCLATVAGGAHALRQPHFVDIDHRRLVGEAQHAVEEARQLVQRRPMEHKEEALQVRLRLQRLGQPEHVSRRSAHARDQRGEARRVQWPDDAVVHEVQA